MLSDICLRAKNVLFIDDNISNLEEAKYYNPELNVALPDFIPNILKHPSSQGKYDIEHSRLNQYKLLEKKENLFRCY